MAMNFGFLDSFRAAVKDERVLALKSSMAANLLPKVGKNIK
jgi:hypothetical protein